ncbi:Chlorophyll a-b binding protein CP26, chloroplastic, partial [Cucurbita argyrosperma subsp. sororia]
MASLAASTAASLGVSEMLGNPLSFSAASARSTPSPSPATFKPVAIFGKKPAPKSKPSTVSPINDELAKWYGPDLKDFFAGRAVGSIRDPGVLERRSPRRLRLRPVWTQQESRKLHQISSL